MASVAHRTSHHAWQLPLHAAAGAVSRLAHWWSADPVSARFAAERDREQRLHLPR